MWKTCFAYACETQLHAQTGALMRQLGRIRLAIMLRYSLYLCDISIACTCIQALSPFQKGHDHVVDMLVRLQGA